MHSKTLPDRLNPRPFLPRRLEGSFNRSNKLHVSTRPSLDSRRQKIGGNEKSSKPMTNEGPWEQ
jgi:hypothetical protein